MFVFSLKCLEYFDKVVDEAVNLHYLPQPIASKTVKGHFEVGEVMEGRRYTRDILGLTIKRTGFANETRDGDYEL